MSRTSRFAGVVVSLLTVALLTFVAATPASAHAVLLDTAPFAGATIPVAPSAVSLTFNEAPLVRFSSIHVTGPDGKRCDAGAVQLTGNVLRERLAGPHPAGRYQVAWRIVADDGHPESGQFTFVVKAAAGAIETAPGTPSAAPSIPLAAPNGANRPPDGNGAGGNVAGSSPAVSQGVFVGLVALVGVLCGFGAWLFLRRRGHEGTE